MINFYPTLYKSAKKLFTVKKQIKLMEKSSRVFHRKPENLHDADIPANK